MLRDDLAGSTTGLRSRESKWAGLDCQPGTAHYGLEEYLGHMLMRVDLLLVREVLRFRHSRSTSGEALDDGWMRFSAITDEEVDGLLDIGSGARDVPDCAWIDQRLEQFAQAQNSRVLASRQTGEAPQFFLLAEAFGLSPLEQDVIALCLAPELDRRYERVLGYLQDDMTCRLPSIGLILSVFCSTTAARIAGRSIFSSNAPLIRHKLLRILEEGGERSALPSRLIKLDERIAAYLLGDPSVDSRIRDILIKSRAGAGRGGLTEKQLAVARSVTSVIEAPGMGAARPPVFYVYGASRVNKAHFVQELCRELDLSLFLANGEQLAASPVGFQEGVPVVLREGVLSQAAIYISHIDAALEQDSGGARLRALQSGLEARRGVVFLGGEKPWRWPMAVDGDRFFPVELPHVGHSDQIQVWKQALSEEGVSDNDLYWLASVYRLSLNDAMEAVQMSKAAVALRGEGGRITSVDIARGCREQCPPNLGQLARRFDVNYCWTDLILPEKPLQQLREICLQVRYRSLIYGKWGFERRLSLGKGVPVLFAGPSGTGKTMSAEVIAGDLGLDLYKIDLSQVVSKYIGETEKNLGQIFDSAQETGAILFFDEADALFGKRSGVKDAHDRYANIEVAYLLQKMEEYEGITVLATNLRQNIDDAFARRIRFIVDFPFPEDEDRLRIWRGIWPEEVPLSSEVDLALLAQQFRLSGGNIRNVALAAAFLAADQGRPVQMKHLMQAATRELQKMGRLVAEDYAGLA